MTLIMGVLNVTPDSFSDGGRFLDPVRAVTHAEKLWADGADIVDIGGESTRPGATRVAPGEEQTRILPVIHAVTAEGMRVSVDTMHAATAVAAVAAGATIVNDVSGGLADPAMFDAVATTDADIVIQHWRGHSDDMYRRAQYEDIVAEVIGELELRVAAARDAGIADERIILDPGFGFGKTPADNWLIIPHLRRLTAGRHRVLIGTSRKRMIAALAGDDPARADLATAVTSVLAARDGVWAVRVHDVASTRLALTVQDRWEGR